jgi:prevent-host-death family protein
VAKTVGAFEAKTHFSALLEEIEQGREITITKHGRPVAKLVPVGEGPPWEPSSRSKGCSSCEAV